MLLSRSAQTVYWFGRYLERAEDLARAVLALDRLGLDMPHSVDHQAGAEPDWRELGAPEAQGVQGAERLGNWLLDERDSSSVLGALHAAREDLRLSRPIVPNDSFRVLNELYLRLCGGKSRSGGVLRGLMGQAIDTCSQLSGQIASGMIRDHAHCFVQLGRSLERADMLLRVTRLFASLERPDRPQPFEDARWISLLESVGAYPMYRRRYHGRVELGRAVDFLFDDPCCPRSLRHCLQDIQRQLLLLPQNRLPLMTLHKCHAVEAPSTLPDVLEYAENMLSRLAALHAVLSSTYFDEPGSAGRDMEPVEPPSEPVEATPRRANDQPELATAYALS